MSNIVKIVIPVAIVVLLVVLGVLIFSGGDDETDEPGREEAAPEREDDEPAVVAKKGSGLFSVDVGRATGTFAVGQANGAIENPSRAAIRISSAPKRKATVTWNLSCHKGANARASRGRYTVTPLNTRTIPLTIERPEICVFAANAQLSARGRIKVTLLGRSRQRQRRR